jgi:two-component system, OmpR family, phosphate regulon sensor histidine kinase PhoR
VTLTVRSKLFLAAFAVGAVSAVTAGVLLSSRLQRLTVERIEQTLAAETRMAAELLRQSSSLPVTELDTEADRLGELVGVRVTFIAPDGKVIGDSSRDGPALAAMENHSQRPEIAEASRRHSEVLIRRYSTTTEYDTLYAAIPITHPAVAFVRLSLPLTEIAQQQRAIMLLALGGIATALPVAALLAWLLSAPLARRVTAIAEVARRYASGDMTRPSRGYGEDELGEVARALDGAIQELGRRVNELAHDRRHLRAILAGMVEGVIVIDAQGRLVMANGAARAMLKLDDSATGRRYQEWMRQSELFAELAMALRGEAPAGVEFVLARDPSRTCVARAAPSGAPEGGAVLVLHDISDLRRADRVRRDFVANVSHELRTPLTAIRGYVEALIDDPPPPGESRRFLEIIARHTDRMERLVKDLLRLARLDAGQETTEMVECDLNALVQGVAHELASVIATKGTTVEIDVAPEVRTITSDSAKLHDVLRNLVENAVNYSPENGTVRVEAEGSDTALTLAVLDSGPGIPAADLTRVFERFYRVDKSRSRAPGGTGIGLAIVKHLVELLGGTVTAANRPEGGAAFIVRLPLGAR